MLLSIAGSCCVSLVGSVIVLISVMGADRKVLVLGLLIFDQSVTVSCVWFIGFDILSLGKSYFISLGCITMLSLVLLFLEVILLSVQFSGCCCVSRITTYQCSPKPSVVFTI